jgi:hypothetical protein
MDRTVSRLVRRLSVVLVLVLAQACGNAGEQRGPDESASAQAPNEPARDLASEPIEQPARDPSIDHVWTAVREHLESADKSISVSDPDTGQPLDLAYTYIEGAGTPSGGLTTTSGGRSFLCVIFHAAEGVPYDVDYYVASRAGEYVVEDIVVHRVNGAVVLSDEERDRLDRVN